MVLAWLINGSLFLFLAWAVVFTLLNKRRSRSLRNTRQLLISRMSGLVISTMLLGIQAILQPQVRYRIAEEQKEEASKDEDGKEPPGGKLFHRQLKKIREGEIPDHPTVKLDSKS
jgi:hypothetical protein